MSLPQGPTLTESLLGQVPKIFKQGTHRASDPDDTLNRVSSAASAVGITRLANITGLDRVGIPVSVAVRPNSRSFSVSQGKGISLAQARTSAVMEALELAHGEDLLGRTEASSFERLAAKANVVDPSVLPGTGKPFPADMVIPWMEGYDLLRQEACWVPWEVVHTDYTFPTAHSGEYLISGTNGLASGNQLVEALGSAICELVERDAVAVWNATPIPQSAARRLDLASVDDPQCVKLLEKYEEADISPRVWDVSSDVGIATYVCDVPAEGEMSLQRFRGSGCHLNRGVALARALTEAAQIRLTYFSGVRDDLPPDDYAHGSRERLGAALIDAASAAAKPLSFAEAPSSDTEDLVTDLVVEIEHLRKSGFTRIVAVDLTRAKLGIPVVRVIIPGLEGLYTNPRYTPGQRARRAAGLLQ
jgi:YcaO-like protein with predicted kinase domain